ncbi:SRPBCC family protein [Streptomyces sp. NPDC048650]|uniref:SRPBCC family protein n=1 Tax=Streptomyces sp. NPDC048650 TaxID=3365583 RepID=UPI0037108405
MTGDLMHHLVRTAVLSADPDAVWRTIGRFGGLADWHPQVPPSVIEGDVDPEVPGATRAFIHDGTVVARERLLAKDDATRSYRYTVLDPFLPLTHYEATLTAVPHAQGTEVRWAATYEGAAEVVAQVEAAFGDAVYAVGLGALATRFAA